MNKLLKMCTFMILIVAGILSGFSIAYAYSTWFSNGISPTPTYVYGYTGFASSTNTAIHNACNEWNTNGGKGNVVYRSTTLHSNTTYPDHNELNQITKGERGTNNYLMLTNPTHYNLFATTLYEGDIDINVSYPFGDATSNGNLYDVEGIMAHEIGHVLGLNHSTASGATMKATISSGDATWRTLEQDDKDGLEAIY